MSLPPAPRHLTTLAPAPALVDQTYQALLDAIVSGELAPGERHTQEGLAQRLGVSRQPILQALLLLRRQGLLKDEPGRRGIEVASLSADFVHQLYEVRGALDGLAARGAAGNPRTDLLESGAALIRRGRLAADEGSTAALVDADLAFHQFIYEAAGNPLLTETAQVHWMHTRRTMAAYLRQTRSLTSVWHEHEAILAAVVDGKPALAEQLAREHCEQSGRIVVDHLYQRAPAVGARGQARSLSMPGASAARS